MSGTSAAPEVGVGLIGASSIAAEFVLDALRSVPEVRLEGVFSSSPERGAAYAAEHGLRPVGSLEAMLADPRVDAVYISTHHDLHAEQALAAIAAGKHVWCEKPIAISLEEAVALGRAADEAGVVFATDHHFRNGRGVRRARELVRSGALGRPLLVRVTQIIEQPADLRVRRLRPDDPAAGVLWDMTVHSADTVAFVLDSDIVEVAALAPREAGPEDTAMGTFRTASGVLASFVDTFNSEHGGSSLEVHGTDATLVVADAMDEYVPATAVLRRGRDAEPVELSEHRDVYAVGAAAFVDAVLGRGVPAADARDGAHSVAVAQAARAAVSEGRVAAVDVDALVPLGPRRVDG